MFVINFCKVWKKDFYQTFNLNFFLRKSLISTKTWSFLERAEEFFYQYLLISASDLKFYLVNIFIPFEMNFPSSI